MDVNFANAIQSSSPKATLQPLNLWKVYKMSALRLSC